jgi:two-component system response regulator FixJ
MARRATPEAGKDAVDDAVQPLRRVYIVDDDIDVRKSLHFLLAAASITAWPFAEAADFLDQLPTLIPAPILLDIRMPGIDGLQLLGLLEARHIDWPVIVMSAHGDVPIAVRAMKLGAIEFLEKPFEPGLLNHALGHGFAVLDRIVSAQHERDRARRLIGLLSPREREIVSLLIEGASNKVAAQRLALSARTVEMHRGNALAKLKVKSVAEAMALMMATNDVH